MSNTDETEVKNVNGLSEEQQLLVERANEIQAVLEKEPKMALRPFLRFPEYGVLPDVRLVIIKNKADDTESGDEGAGGESDTPSETEHTGEQPVEA